MSPSVARRAVEWIWEIDIRWVLPSIQANTLVVHRRDARFHPLQLGQHLAENIKGARLVVIDGEDTLPFHAGDPTQTLEAIEDFLTGEQRSVRTNRMLATILISDIVGSTTLASDAGDDRWLDVRTEHNRLVRLQPSTSPPA